MSIYSCHFHNKAAESYSLSTCLLGYRWLKTVKIFSVPEGCAILSFLKIDKLTLFAFLHSILVKCGTSVQWTFIAQYDPEFYLVTKTGFNNGVWLESYCYKSWLIECHCQKLSELCARFTLDYWDHFQFHTEMQSISSNVPIDTKTWTHLSADC